MAIDTMAGIYEEAGRGGRIFSVEFEKLNGLKRLMVCRGGVTQHLKGGKLKFDPEERGLRVVFDVNSGGYRMVPLDPSRVARVKGCGKTLYERGATPDEVA